MNHSLLGLAQKTNRTMPVKRRIIITNDHGQGVQLNEQELNECALSDWLLQAKIVPTEQEWQCHCEAIEEDRRGLYRGELRDIKRGKHAKINAKRGPDFWAAQYTKRVERNKLKAIRAVKKSKGAQWHITHTQPQSSAA